MASNDLFKKNIIALTVNVIMRWVLLIGVVFFVFFGAEYISTPKNLYYLIIGIIAVIAWGSLDYATSNNKKTKFKIWGYVKDEDLTLDFFIKNPYWKKPYRVLLVSLMIYLSVVMISTVFVNASALDGVSLAETTPKLFDIDTDNIHINALEHVSPGTLAELAISMLVLSLIFSTFNATLGYFGISKNIILLLTGTIGALLFGYFARFWHSRAYGADQFPLAYITIFFALGAVLTIITGGGMVFDVMHVINNYVLGLMLTVAGILFLKVASPIAFALVFTIWTIDRANFRKPKKKAKSSIRRLSQNVGNFFYPKGLPFFRKRARS